MSNSLAAMRPELVREWSDKNLPLTPDKITYGSNKIVWWKAACGHGWQTSVTVRQKEDGRYELVSGHRRKKACELAGFEMLRCEVVELTKDEATILMVESNFQRSQILPSEKAYAYKMRLEAMKRQAGRPSNPPACPWRAFQVLCKLKI